MNPGFVQDSFFELMKMIHQNDLGLWKKSFKILLGICLIGVGIGHLTWLKTDFFAQVPRWLPLDEELVVILSGLVEIILGSVLIFKKKNVDHIGLVVALFFIAIFPGNISQYLNQIDAFGLNSDRARFVRLFFQPVLILGSLWSCGYFIRMNILRSKNK